ncbi:hypothetical protein ACU4GG_40720 [Streptomyces nojiriensis]
MRPSAGRPRPPRGAQRSGHLCLAPLDWQRHCRVLADLVDTEGQLPDTAPSVLTDGDGVGPRLQQQKQPAI